MQTYSHRQLNTKVKARIKKKKIFGIKNVKFYPKNYNNMRPTY